MAVARGLGRRVTTRIGMQAGETPFYDLVLVRNDGRRVPAGRGLCDKRKAEWLADTVREALKRVSGSGARDSRRR